MNYVIKSISKGGEVRNGKLYATGVSRMDYIRVVFDIQIDEKGLLYADAWERSYGELTWRQPEIPSTGQYPWYFCVLNEDKTHFLGIGVKTLPNAICGWRLVAEGVELVADIRCGTHPVEIDGELEVCEFVFWEEDTDDPQKSMKAFCQKLVSMPPVLPSSPIYGGNNWYYTYGDSDAERFLRDAQNIARWSQGLKTRPYAVVDTCWQTVMLNEDITAGGPYYPQGNYRYPNMPQIAEKVKEMDVHPGIWYRPLKTVQTLPPHYFLHKTVLDPTVPEVQDMLKADAAKIHSWGYDLLKHDFSTFDIIGMWGKSMENGIDYAHRDSMYSDFSFFDPTCTTAMALKIVNRKVFEGRGSALILSCNVMGHLTVGYSHIQRIGDDTSGLDFERTRFMGVNTLAFRLHQDGVFFAADADCVGITSKIPWRLNSNWMRLIAKTGTPLFVCADPAFMNAEREKEIEEAFHTVCEQGVRAIPQDWYENKTPETWSFNGEIEQFAWR